MSRAIIIMLDSLGMGGAPDAASFNDVGANTLGALARYAKESNSPFNIPHLLSLGLGKAAELSVGHALEGMPETEHLIGSFGACTEISKGKDTPSGHWEMAGVPVLFDWGYFTKPVNSFPKPLIDKILTRAGLKGSLGNCHASGTDILIALGDEHLKTGLPIFYTSSDSVFQIACHEAAFGLDRLYKLCLIAREELMPYNIGRVIARPFIGDNANNFARTGNRKDYSVEPPAKTVLQKLIEEKQGMVYAIGKIADIYAHSGISYEIKATGFDELYKATFEAMQSAPSNSIIFTNFVDFDSSFGHRRDIKGYKEALERFDARLPELFDRMLPDDVLYITADHGCDPSWIGTDHTRERVPILIYGKNLTSRTLGIRETFADIGQTIAEQFALSPMDHGTALFADLPKNPPS